MSSAVTIYAQHAGGALKNLETAPFGPRLANAPVAYTTYIIKTFWPHDLALLYPFSSFIPAWQIVGSLIVLVLFTVWLIRVRRRSPYLLVGWFWFLFTLVPVIGIVQVGGQSMADRYTYIPLTGMFILCAWGSDDLFQGWHYRKEVLSVLAAMIVAVSGAVTWLQISYWRDNLSLYRHTLDVTEGNYLILNNFGIALAQEGRLYQEALRVWPRAASAHVNLGAALAKQGKIAEALIHYRQALQIVPDYALALENMGRALAALGRGDEAAASYVESLRLDPTRSDAHLSLALLLVKQGRLDEGWRHYEIAQRLEPYSVKPPINMGASLAQQGRPDEAADCFRQALRIDQGSIEAHFNLGVLLARQNRVEEAAHHFSEVLRLKPDTEAARRWMEVLERQRNSLSPK
jgi:tetratricopeptide (TPR) repeat protein